MDAFESVIKLLLERQGYWVHSNYKVMLTKEEKRRLGKPSLPAVDLDLLAYRPENNEVFVVECKSFLDSPGVRADSFLNDQDKDSSRYKLFVKKECRDTVFARLEYQLLEQKRARRQPHVRLCLAVGKVAGEGSRRELHRHFEQQGWILWDDRWIREELQRTAESSYENQVPLIVTKILVRPQG